MWMVLILLLHLSGVCISIKEAKLIGVKIYDHPGELPELFDTWKELGINAVFSSESLISRPKFRLLADEFDITTFVLFPVFQNPDLLDMDPDLGAVTADGKRAVEEWVVFWSWDQLEEQPGKIQVLKDILKGLILQYRVDCRTVINSYFYFQNLPIYHENTYSFYGHDPDYHSMPGNFRTGSKRSVD
jgi:hypothetical protein